MMAGRKHMIVLSTGSDAHGAIHSRAWYIQPEALDHLATLLTSSYGQPFEWVSDETEPGKPAHLVYYDGDTP